MLFHPAERPKPKNYDGKAHYSYAEVKHDGWRLTLVREGWKLMAFGRNVRDLFSSLSPELQRLAHSMPDNTVIDGELFVPGMHATEVPRALKRRDSRLAFVGFAMPVYMGTCMRLQPLEFARMRIKGLGFDVPVQFARDSPLYHDEEDVDRWRRIATNQKIEGLVLKEAHWSGWWKVKPYQSIDGYVISVKPGRGKHEGRVGSLEVAVRRADGSDVVIADVGTGGDEHWRDEYPGRLLGRVVEVLFDEVGAGGRLKFPRFSRWRPDKPLGECTEDQLP